MVSSSCWLDSVLYLKPLRKDPDDVCIPLFNQGIKKIISVASFPSENCRKFPFLEPLEGGGWKIPLGSYGASLENTPAISSRCQQLHSSFGRERHSTMELRGANRRASVDKQHPGRVQGEDAGLG